MPDPAASTQSPGPDDSLTSPAWADATSSGMSPDPHDAQTANTPATGGNSEITDYGLGVGRSVGKYRILKRLGSGGNGQVYSALHTELGKTVALKFFKGYVAAQPQQDAMRREAQTLAALRHPGIVLVDDFSIYEVPRAEAGVSPSSPAVPIPFIVMEYIPSEQTLGVWNRAHTPGVAEILRIGAEMCDAVEHAHGRGIIHRDLKPGNVLVDVGADNKPHPRVIDFGLSQLLAGYGMGPVGSRAEFDRVTGTLQYMSPEQLAGNSMLVDHRSDVYALGVVIYELLCGRLPYNVSVKLTGELTNEIRNGVLIRPSTIRPDLKGPIEDVLMRALEKDPAKRHQRAGDLADDLRRILNDQPLEWRAEPVVERAGRAARAVTKRSRALIAITAAVAATCAAFALWTYVAWDPMRVAFERLATRVGGPSVTSIENVRILELRDGLDIGVLAKLIGVEGVATGDMRSVRRLHGRLMERLAGAQPRAVVFDLHFPQASLHDDAFNRGVAALNEAGIDAVVGVKVVRTITPAHGDARAMSTTPSGPAIAETIRGGGARWGYIQFNSTQGCPLTVALVTKQGTQGYIPSLAMSALAAARWPRMRPEFEALEDPAQQTLLNSAPATLYVRCFGEGTSPTTAHRPTASATFKISLLGDWEEYASLGYAEGDEGAMWTVPFPPREALVAASRDYAEVLAESDESLRAWAKDKIILVGDARTGVDRGDFGPFTDTPYVYAHATAIETLTREIALRYPTVQQNFWTALFGAMVGAVLGLTLAGRPRTQVVVALASVAGLTGGSLLLYAAGGIVANPFILVAALLIAMALTAGLGRLASRGTAVYLAGSPA